MTPTVKWEELQNKLYVRTKARLTRLIYLRAKTKGKEWDVRDIVLEIAEIYAKIILSYRSSLLVQIEKEVGGMKVEENEVNLERADDKTIIEGKERNQALDDVCAALKRMKI